MQTSKTTRNSCGVACQAGARLIRTVWEVPRLWSAAPRGPVAQRSLTKRPTSCPSYTSEGDQTQPARHRRKDGGGGTHCELHPTSYSKHSNFPRSCLYRATVGLPTSLLRSRAVQSSTSSFSVCLKASSLRAASSAAWRAHSSTRRCHSDASCSSRCGQPDGGDTMATQVKRGSGRL